MKAFRFLLRDFNLDDFLTANLEDLINFISLLKTIFDSLTAEI